MVAWPHRRVRLDEDAYLVLDGIRSCTLHADADAGVDSVTLAVSAGERAAALAQALAVLPGAEAEQAAPLASAGFADHLRPIEGAAGRRLLAIAAAPGLACRSDPGEVGALLREVFAEELALRRKAACLGCVKPETREALLRRLLRAADFIASHYDQPLSLEQMAQAASLSRFHFVRLFGIVHGETPHAFLLRKRIAVARRHLARGGARSEAAARAGFGSRSALFRNLRKAGRGVAPAAAASLPSATCCRSA